MDKFTTLTGIAAPMPLVNIDTDMIIPKQFLKTIQRSGLGKNLFDEMRYTQDGAEIPDFVLNQPAYRKAQIIVAGDNFGCGSSREHAPWALLDFGIRCVISTSFADIFFNNCFKNGILPVVLPQEAVDHLMEDARKGENARLTVDLENQTVTASDGTSFAFEVDAFKKHCMLNGLDDIGLTLERAGSIDAAFSSVRPMSSSPFNRQCFLKASTSKAKVVPSDAVTVCDARSTVIRAFAPFFASSIRWATASGGRTTGRMPFLKQLLKKMSAKLVEITQRMPKSSSAQGACSRDEPQPKLSPATMISALRQAGWFSTKSGISCPSGV